jgi:hypothetical protein
MAAKGKRNKSLGRFNIPKSSDPDAHKYDGDAFRLVDMDRTGGSVKELKKTYLLQVTFFKKTFMIHMSIIRKTCYYLLGDFIKMLEDKPVSEYDDILSTLFKKFGILTTCPHDYWLTFKGVFHLLTKMGKELEFEVDDTEVLVRHDSLLKSGRFRDFEKRLLDSIQAIDKNYARAEIFRTFVASQQVKDLIEILAEYRSNYPKDDTSIVDEYDTPHKCITQIQECIHLILTQPLNNGKRAREDDVF